MLMVWLTGSYDLVRIDLAMAALPSRTTGADAAEKTLHQGTDNRVAMTHGYPDWRPPTGRLTGYFQLNVGNTAKRWSAAVLLRIREAMNDET